MPNETQWRTSRARQMLYGSLRRTFAALGYDEVETPLLVGAPGMEPHINPFEVPFVPETEIGQRRTLYLHTSPEYAMKRLLADGCGPIFQLCKVFRNGEVSRTHNPEFTLLEYYRPQADYHAIMADLERLLAEAERAVTGRPGPFSRVPYERLSVRDAVLRETGIDILKSNDAGALAREAKRLGIGAREGDSFDDVFFRLFLEKVEPRLGADRPTFLIEYPASMAALARLKPGDPRVAERVELYVRGLELGNGFSELIDAHEQRTRLVEEQALRQRLGRTVFPLDEQFLGALAKMPPSGGIAVGLDRILMLMMEVERIEDVLLFPAHEFV